MQTDPFSRHQDETTEDQNAVVEFLQVDHFRPKKSL